jgi:hypothetical protein
MVLSALCFSPKLSFADFDNACINLEHFVDDTLKDVLDNVYDMLNRTKFVIPGCAMHLTCNSVFSGMSYVEGAHSSLQLRREISVLS